ncbi:nuclear transport factor 2 family protein [Thalassomonas sp. RHCl1]|uniref:nuclear transport factor 2 family protein n=1 Tax=Thalassomonas sp. RHCl1 TaxID=2995320 RepID=UPI00248AA827|nr:nuclear transport factor 2 family protein [Thalassomonas sp. RHCl1]
MPIFKSLIVVLSLVITTSAYAQEKPFRVVQELFSAMSAIDHKKMQAVVTDDFQLLEAGEDWDMQDLIDVIKPSDYNRRNYFHLINSRVYGDIAWVSYWNKATFSKEKNKEKNEGNSEQAVAWLESAVLVKQDNRWKIQMLHSTRIKAEQIPSDLALSEYTD